MVCSRRRTLYYMALTQGVIELCLSCNLLLFGAVNYASLPPLSADIWNFLSWKVLLVINVVNTLRYVVTLATLRPIEGPFRENRRPLTRLFGITQGTLISFVLSAGNVWGAACALAPPPDCCAVSQAADERSLVQVTGSVVLFWGTATFNIMFSVIWLDRLYFEFQTGPHGRAVWRVHQDPSDGRPIRGAWPALPVTTFELMGDVRECNSSCVICLEDLSAGCQVGRLPCKHVFHDECIRRWLHGHEWNCQAQCPMRCASVGRGGKPSSVVSSLFGRASSLGSGGPEPDAQRDAPV